MVRKNERKLLDSNITTVGSQICWKQTLWIYISRRCIGAMHKISQPWKLSNWRMNFIFGNAVWNMKGDDWRRSNVFDFNMNRIKGWRWELLKVVLHELHLCASGCRSAPIGTRKYEVELSETIAMPSKSLMIRILYLLVFKYL